MNCGNSYDLFLVLLVGLLLAGLFGAISGGQLLLILFVSVPTIMIVGLIIGRILNKGPFDIEDDYY